MLPSSLWALTSTKRTVLLLVLFGAALAIRLPYLPSIVDTMVIVIAGVGERLGDALANIWLARSAYERVMVALVLIGGAVSAFYRDRTTAKASGSRGFVVAVLCGPILLLPLISRSFQSRYLLFLLPAAFVCVGIAITRLAEAVAPSRVGPSRQRRRRQAARIALFSLVPILASTGLFAAARVQRHFVDQQLTNDVFFRLTDAVAPNATCADQVFVEDTDKLPIPDPERAWVYYNLHSVRMMLTLSGCRLTLLPGERLPALVAAQPSAVWLVVPEQSVPAFAGTADLTAVMPIAHKPLIPDELSLVLFRAQRRQ